jgi:hypothetical protein
MTLVDRKALLTVKHMLAGDSNIAIQYVLNQPTGSSELQVTCHRASRLESDWELAREVT